MTRLSVTLAAALFFLPAALFAAAPATAPVIVNDDWIDAMKKVHAGFTGTAGYVAQYGDSITFSMAFWAPMDYVDPTPALKESPDGLPLTPEGKRWRDVILGCRDKGPEFACYSGWRVEDVLKALPKALAAKKPEVAILMLGTNDISGNSVPAGYKPGLEKIVQSCLDAHCIVILNTIPPRRDHEQAVNDANKAVAEVAAKFKVPLVDFHAQIIAHAPGSKWDTLMAADGVHPSAGNNGDFSAANLSKSGYALRTWVNFLAYRQVYFKVLHP